MRLSNLKIYVVISAVAISMAGLLYVQLKLVREDISVFEQQFNLTVPEYINEIQSSIRNSERIRRWVNAYDEEPQDFVIESFERYPEQTVYSLLKNTIDSVFKQNNLDIEYEVNGLIAAHTQCFFYANDRVKGVNTRIDEIVDHDLFMCLCGPNPGRSHGHHGAGDYTALDISIDYPNRLGYFIGENGPLMRTSLLLLLILLIAFSYTVITINRQKKLSDLKNDFINNLTHEFKTPIFSISLASGLLKKSEEVKKSERLTKYTELIDNEGKRLKSQVDKILQIALIDSGNFRLEKKKLDIHELIEKVSRSFELIINERAGSLDLELEAHESIVLADETHLNNIIYNLLDNAVKYTEQSPEIVVKTIVVDKGLNLQIKDNGIGISEDVQKFIFDKFYRARSGDLHNVKGFGLGLSYVKSVVEAHNGRIKIQSKRNKGSVFNIYLPFD